MRGSIRNGYATSASRLPALLAEYRKYGSREAAWVVRASQFWRSGAVDETTKKGTAAYTASTVSNCINGCKEKDSDEATVKWIGRNASGRSRTMACAATCFRTSAILASRCA